MAQRGNARDFLYIALGVGAVFGLLFVYSGVWPPVFTVETGSMMHVDRVEWFSGQGDTRDDDTRFGRVGTLDPGDLVLVKEIDEPGDVTTFAQAEDEEDYGDRGEVIAFRLRVDDQQRTIVHRAMTYVNIEGRGDQAQYRVYWSPDWEEQGDCVRTPTYVCTFSVEEGVTIRELGINGQSFTQEGFITKGDNIASNPGADQAPPANPTQDALAPEPIRPASVVGEAQGEVPAIGLLRVAFSGQTLKNAEMQDHSAWLRIGNVVAPLDLWGLVLIELGLMVTAPLLVTMARDFFSKPTRKVTGELSVLEEMWRDTRVANRGSQGAGKGRRGSRPRE